MHLPEGPVRRGAPARRLATDVWLQWDDREVRVKPTTIGQAELEHFLQVSRVVFRDATVASPRGQAVCATPPEGKYPFVHTRDLALAVAGLCELGALSTAR